MVHLVMFSGLPGTGKSTLSYDLAQKTQWALLTKDQIDRSLERESVKNSIASYHVLLGLAKLNIKNNVSVILDATFSRQGFRDEIEEISKEFGAKLSCIYCYCSDEITWQDRLQSRPEMVDGWTPADWQEVKRVQEHFAPWVSSGLKLDAMGNLEQNKSKLFEYING